MNKVLLQNNVDFLTLYVDDNNIKNLCHMKYVLDKLKEGSLTVHWEKSKFLQKEILFGDI